MGKKLLVADDSLTIQKVIKLALSHDGYEIQTVADGNELMAQVSLFRPDVLLIDLGLPGKTTFEIKKELNETEDLKDIPCVLMASAFEKVDEAKVGLLGFDGRLTKPFDPSHLREVLQKAIQSRALPTDFDPATLPPPPQKKSNALPTFEAPSAHESLNLDPTGTISLSDPLWASENPVDLSFTDHLPPPPTDGGTGFIKPDEIETPSAPAPDFSHSNQNEDGSKPLYETDEKTDEVDLSTLQEDSDIKHLTESTVRMSGGLDDLGGWNINESASSSLPPIPSIFEPSRLDIERSLEEGHHEPAPPKPQHRPTAPPPPPQPAHLTSSSTSSSSSGNATSVSRVEEALADLPSSREIEEMVEKQVRAQLEEMIQGQVSQHLEKFVKNGLPDLAERIVKQEIRKLLEGLS